MCWSHVLIKFQAFSPKFVRTYFLQNSPKAATSVRFSFQRAVLKELSKIVRPLSRLNFEPSQIFSLIFPSCFYSIYFFLLLENLREKLFKLVENKHRKNQVSNELLRLSISQKGYIQKQLRLNSENLCHGFSKIWAWSTSEFLFRTCREIYKLKS